MKWTLRAVVCLVLGATVVAQGQAQRPGQMPTLPLTQLDERGPAEDLDGRAFTLTFAQPIPIKDLLVLLVRGTNLSVVPDPGITDSFIGELKSVTVRQALDSILPSLGLEYRVAGNLIRVFRRELQTRLYNVNYIATDRTGSSVVGNEPTAASPGTASVTSVTKVDLFAELTRGVQSLLSDRATFSLDRKAGLLQVTDFSERLDRVSEYLDAVQERLHRQVQLDARIVEVELLDPMSQGIDWDVIATGLLVSGGTTPASPARRLLTGLRVTDVTRLLELLAAQGKVTTLDRPRVIALNNEPAIVRGATLTLGVTPQIAPDGVVMLSLTPLLKTPWLAEADALARVSDGETLVVSGFSSTREVRERTNAGTGGGWFGRRTVVTNKRVELLVLLTPRILAS